MTRIFQRDICGLPTKKVENVSKRKLFFTSSPIVKNFAGDLGSVEALCILHPNIEGSWKGAVS